MLRSIATTLAILIAGPVHALTCAAQDIATTYQSVHDSTEAYVIAHGAMIRTGENTPSGPESDDPEFAPVGYTFPALIQARFAASNGFGNVRRERVVVDVRCAASWCGADSLSADGLYFLRRTSLGMVLEAGPCPFYFFDAPTQAQLDEIERLLP